MTVELSALNLTQLDHDGILWFGYSESFFIGFDGRPTRLLNSNEDLSHVIGELLPVVLGRLQTGLLEPSLHLSLPMCIILVNV